jgi:hypothetical protein
MRDQLNRVSTTFTVILLLAMAVAPAVTAAATRDVNQIPVVVPLSFEQNLGQVGPSFPFIARGPGYSCLASSRELRLRLGIEELRIGFPGASAGVPLEGVDTLPGRVNYLIGADPKGWLTDVPTFARVRAGDLYPGIDLVLYGNQRQLEFDFVVAAHADPGVIRLSISGHRGLSVDASGDLVVRLAAGELRQHRPVVYQVMGDERRLVSAEYAIVARDTVAFRLGEYDPVLPLVIDPVLSYGTYFGGSMGDSGAAIALDAQGNIYVAGLTGSEDLPVKNAYLPTLPAGATSYVVKLAAGGASVVYCTYIGGGDTVGGLGVDAAGQATIVGRTWGDLPTKNSLQGTLRGGSDAFVLRLNATGNQLVYSTYLGGSDNDEAYDVAVRSSGETYVTGYAISTDFPLENAYQDTNRGNADAFVAVLNAAGSALLLSTYLGGEEGEEALSVAFDTSGNIYVAGATFSVDFPTKNAYESDKPGNLDWFIAKLGLGSGDLVYSTYFGLGGVEGANSIAVDATGGAVVVGDCVNCTTLNPLQPNGAGMFILKLTPAGNQLVFATPFGGEDGYQTAEDVALDTSGNIYVAGHTNASDFPSTNPFQACHSDLTDAIALKLNSSGSTVLYSSCIGGTAGDLAYGIAVDGAGAAYLTGNTVSADFPVQSPYQATLKGDQDAFVVKLPGSATPTSYTYVIPSVAHAPGAGTSQWRSSVFAVNQAATASQLTLTLLSTGGETRTKAITLAAKATVEWADILANAAVFAYPASTSVKGSLQILSTQPLHVFSRTFNQATSGTFGQYYPALQATQAISAGQTGTLPGVRKNTAFRSNVGIQNLGETTSQVRVTLFNGSGAQVGNAVTETVSAWAWKQIDDICGKAAAGNQELAYAKVEVLTAGGRAWAYLSVVDNITGDPMTVPLMTP